MNKKSTSALDAKSATAIARNAESTEDQLALAVNVSETVDRILAKHPNVSPALLERLSRSSDKPTRRNVARNSNTPAGVLAEIGQDHPGALFKNPALASIVWSDKTFLAGFEPAKLSNALMRKDCPEAVIDWVLKHGNASHQASLLFGVDRSPDLVARFRKSRHSRIVTAILAKSEESYLAWATDLGFTMPDESGMNDRESALSLRERIDHWVAEKTLEMSALWGRLVPRQGCADSLQGELVRALGRIANEYFRNGMTNWGGGYYKPLAKVICDTLTAEPTFSPWVKRIVRADIDEVKQSGRTGEEIAKGKQPMEAAFPRNLLCGGDVDSALERLGAVIAVWCSRHADPIPYPEEPIGTALNGPALVVPCPQCGGVVREGAQRYACAGVLGEVAGCGLSIPKKVARRLIETGEVEALLRDRVVGPLQGFRSISGRPFAATLRIDKEAKLAFDFGADPQNDADAASADFSSQSALGACPKCGAAVFEHGSAYVCQQSVGTQPTCDFRLGNVLFQKKIAPEQMSKLLVNGRTEILRGFVSARTRRKFSARLVRDEGGKVRFEFEA